MFAVLAVSVGAHNSITLKGGKADKDRLTVENYRVERTDSKNTSGDCQFLHLF